MMELSQPVRLSESYERLSKSGLMGKKELEIDRAFEKVDDYGAPTVKNVERNEAKIDWNSDQDLKETIHEVNQSTID